MPEITPTSNLIPTLGRSKHRPIVSVDVQIRVQPRWPLPDTRSRVNAEILQSRFDQIAREHALELQRRLESLIRDIDLDLEAES